MYHLDIVQKQSRIVPNKYGIAKVLISPFPFWYSKMTRPDVDMLIKYSFPWITNSLRKYLKENFNGSSW